MFSVLVVDGWTWWTTVFVLLGLSLIGYSIYLLLRNWEEVSLVPFVFGMVAFAMPLGFAYYDAQAAEISQAFRPLGLEVFVPDGSHDSALLTRPSTHCTVPVKFTDYGSGRMFFIENDKAAGGHYLEEFKALLAQRCPP